MYSVWVAWKSALEGGEIIEWCLSTNKWHTLCLSRLTCPLLFGSQHIQLLNVSQLLGDKHRTCCSQWLHACIFTRGLVGLGFLSRLSPEWVKGETARREPHIKIFFQKKKNFFPPPHQFSLPVYWALGAWSQRTLYYQAPVCKTPAWLAPFFY